MAKTPSHMIPLGTVAPQFTLKEVVSEKKLSLLDLRGKSATVIMFICNHCPFVQHINRGLVSLAKDYSGDEVSFIAISSNDAETYPQDGPQEMKLHAKKEGYPFPYLYDKTQQVAKDYQAACTPDFYIFDKELKCAYRGQMDDSRPDTDIPVTGKDIRNALDALLKGVRPSIDQKSSLGCNIKWKPV